MTRLRTLTAAAALLLTSGCYNVTYMSKTRMPAAVVHEEKMNFFIFGLVGEHDIQAAQICPTGVAKIRTTETGVNVLLTIITLGIYSPRTAQITCAK
jgi:hypothetical protein